MIRAVLAELDALTGSLIHGADDYARRVCALAADPFAPAAPPLITTPAAPGRDPRAPRADLPAGRDHQAHTGGSAVATTGRPGPDAG